MKTLNFCDIEINQEILLGWLGIHICVTYIIIPGVCHNALKAFTVTKNTTGEDIVMLWPLSLMHCRVVLLFARNQN
jgi:hypothetical protein